MEEKNITEENGLSHAREILNDMLSPLNKENRKELLKLLLALTKEL